MLLFYSFVKYELIETMNVIVARPPETLVAESDASSCLIMFHTKCLWSPVGVRNIISIEQGFPPLPCMRQVNLTGAMHIQEEGRPAAVERVCKYLLMLILVVCVFMLQKFMVYSLMQKETILFHCY